MSIPRITINGQTLSTGPGQNTIDLQGTYGLPQPGLASGLEIAPSSPGCCANTLVYRHAALQIPDYDEFRVGRTAIDQPVFLPVPAPAALPLLATGLGALGLLSWRRRRKAQEINLFD